MVGNQGIISCVFEKVGLCDFYAYSDFKEMHIFGESGKRKCRRFRLRKTHVRTRRSNRVAAFQAGSRELTQTNFVFA